jgi:hypothetical protein
MDHFRTTRLVGRDWTAQDAPAAFGIYGRDEVMRWLGAQPRRTAAARGCVAVGDATGLS